MRQFKKYKACGHKFNCSATAIEERDLCCSGIAAAVDPAFAQAHELVFPLSSPEKVIL